MSKTPPYGFKPQMILKTEDINRKLIETTQDTREHYTKTEVQEILLDLIATRQCLVGVGNKLKGKTTTISTLSKSLDQEKTSVRALWRSIAVYRRLLGLDPLPESHKRGYTELEKSMHLKGTHCNYCGSSENLTRDHILPRSKGGSNSEKNIQTLCHTCNQKKADNYPYSPESL